MFDLRMCTSSCAMVVCVSFSKAFSGISTVAGVKFVSLDAAVKSIFNCHLALEEAHHKGAACSAERLSLQPQPGRICHALFLGPQLASQNKARVPARNLAGTSICPLLLLPESDSCIPAAALPVSLCLCSTAPCLDGCTLGLVCELVASSIVVLTSTFTPTRECCCCCC